MTDWKASGMRTATRLRRSGVGGGLVAIVILSTAPLLIGTHGFSTPLGWWLLLAPVLVALALSAHLVFDAVLFRLAASHDNEQAGLVAIDDTLLRMGLCVPAAETRPLDHRIRGSHRLVWLQWLALGIAVLLYAILFVDATNGAPAC